MCSTPTTVSALCRLSMAVSATFPPFSTAFDSGDGICFATFTGDRGTLNNEYQGLLSEVNRQAANVNLNTGGSYNTNLVTYVGGGNNQANAQVSVDLSGANNAVDSTALGIQNSSVAGGGTELTGNSVSLDDTASFSGRGSIRQNYTFHIGTSTGNQDVTVSVAGGSGGLTRAAGGQQLNSQLSSFGINAGIASDGVQFGGSTAFTVNVGAASGGNATATSTGDRLSIPRTTTSTVQAGWVARLRHSPERRR